MASARQNILDNIETTLNKILVASGYNFDVKRVVKGKIVPVGKIPLDWRSAYISFIYSGQTNTRGGSDTLRSAMDVQIYAAMANETSANFMLFLDDIEASLAKDPSRDGLANSTYNVIDSFISSITVFDTQEVDEVLSPTDQQYKQREALIGFSVSYNYHAGFISGD